MRIRTFRSALDECLASLQHGETLDSCLTRYPRHAERLRPLLTLAQRVSHTPTAVPRPTAQTTAWNVVRQRAADLRSGRRRTRAVQTPWLRPLALATAVVLAMLGAGAGTVYAAQDSLPGDPLYRVKLASEEARLWITFDEVDRADLLLDQSQERTEEIMTLVQQGKPVPGIALSTLRDRSDRAAGIVSDRPQETVLLARLLEQSQAQEDLLLALWDEVSESARDDYAETVASLHNTRLASAGAVAAVEPADFAGGVLTISGGVEAVTEGVWRVGGLEVRVDSRTFGANQVTPGETVKVIAARGANGRLHAVTLSALQTGGPGSGAVVSALLQEVSDGEIVVAGQHIAITSETLLKLKPRAGQVVQITVKPAAGKAVASSVQAVGDSAASPGAPTLAYEGTIQGEVSTSSTSNEWVIGGQTFVVTPATIVDAQGGDVTPGARAWVEAAAHGGRLLASRVTTLAAQAEADSVRLTGTFQGTKQGLWLVSGLAVRPPEGAEVPAPASVVSVSARRENGNTVADRAEVLQQPGQEVIRLQGTISSREGDAWTVGFAPLRVPVETKVIGDPAVGARAIVWARQGGDGAVEAIFVLVLDQHPIAGESR